MHGHSVIVTTTPANKEATTTPKAKLFYSEHKLLLSEHKQATNKQGQSQGLPNCVTHQVHITSPPATTAMAAY